MYEHFCYMAPVLKGHGTENKEAGSSRKKQWLPLCSRVCVCSMSSMHKALSPIHSTAKKKGGGEEIKWEGEWRGPEAPLL